MVAYDTEADNTEAGPTPAPTRRKLYKDPTDTMIAGVASGVAKFFDIDTALVRVAWAASIFFGGFGVLLYLLLWIILDDEPEALTTT